jgi:ABC-type sugar transport system ATPase subunit
MSLLELERVGKRYRDADLERAVLRDVSLELETGELAVVWGLRGSGRSTLLRVAAGIEAPETGVVRFEGRDLHGHAEETLGAGIGFCERTLAGNGARPVLEVLMVVLLARGVPQPQARSRAREALERTGAAGCAQQLVSRLDTAETVRVAIARVLALAPRLIVIDEPIAGVDLLQRDGILALLSSLARDGVAVLASAGESTALSGADRAFSLSEGELSGAPARELAPVLPLRRAQARGAGA